jgi:hypothetical protein
VIVGAGMGVVGFSLALALTVCVGLGAVLRIADGILHIAPRLLGFALDLLGGAFGLSLGVARPLADLTLRAAYCVVYCTLHSILVHNSTSWWLIEKHNFELPLF